MKHIYLLLLAAILAVFSAACGSDKQPEEEEQPPVTPAEVVAFPGAEGFGRLTTGGRGGKVLYVTTLSDSDTLGSLRWAVNQTGKRTIIFKVAGNIVLSSRLSIKNGDVTIAGQSAPGAGICISGHEVVVAASNVIIRYLRFRMGDATKVQGDAFGGYNQKNIIIDHCSMSWGTDEVSSWYENENFTMQWCLLAESLRVSVHVKGPHGLTGIWGGHKASFHHNMIAHSDDRNPRFCGSLYSNRPDEELVDFRNNVIYNWGSNSGYGGEGGSYNMVNNYYQPGEGSGSKTRIFAPNPDNGANIQQAGVWGTFYVAGNLMMNANGTVNTSVTADNWEGIHPKNGKNKNELKSATEFEKGEVTTHTAQEAYDLVLAKVGASLKRDNTDTRIVDEARNRLTPVRASGGGNTKPGLIDSQNDVGGWDTYTYNAADVPDYSEADGIPKAWLQANGLSAGDGSKTAANGYTNLENYLNSLVTP